MKKVQIIISIAVILFLLSCSLIDQKESLTSSQVENYLDVYTEIREEAPEILEAINKNPKNAEVGKEQYQKIQSIIKNSEFENYAQFIVINAKIGTIFSLIKAQDGMEDFENLNENSNKMIDDGIAEIDKILNDPEISEEIKAEQRKLKEELLKNAEKLNIDWDKNKKWAEKVLKSTKKISGMFISKQDIELVKQYEQEISEAYTGFQIPEIPNATFPKLDLENY